MNEQHKDMNNYITQGTTITVQTSVFEIKIAEYPKIFSRQDKSGTIFAIEKAY